MTVILQIGGAGLSLWRDGELLLDSPAYITLDGKRALIGAAAKAQVKLKPTITEYEFWDKFSLDPLPRRNRLASTQADLAYMHLADLWQRSDSTDQVVIAVPGDFSKSQLGMLLGMAQRLRIPVQGVIDSAILHSHNEAPGRNLYHLDQHSHRLLLTELEQAQQLTVTACRASRELGLLRWRDAWSMAIADAFINATRLDPLHDAAVEQQLFDQLFEWLQDLSRQTEIEPELSHADQLFRAPVTQVQLSQASARLLSDLLDWLGDELRLPATVQIDQSFAALPGVLQALQGVPELEVITLPVAKELPPTLLESITASGTNTPGQTTFIRSRPWLGQTEQRLHQSALAGFSRRLPTHLLQDGVALPLAVNTTVGAAKDATIVLDARFGIAPQHALLARSDDKILVHAVNGSAITVNGRGVTDTQAVAAGDRVRLGQPGVELQLIAVEN